MIRLHPTLIATLALLGFMGCAQLATPPPTRTTAWPHETSDLKPDPDVRWGRLENGLRYAILPHTTPANRASVFLHVDVGSLHEGNRERGYAHFVEHMAFGALRDFPDGPFDTLQRLGAGPHANAATGPFETAYYFPNLPLDEPTALPTGLALLRSIADGIVFDPEAVVRERSIIAGEARSHAGMLARSRADELEYLPPRELTPRWPEAAVVLANTRAADRHPLGDEKSMQRATATKLRAFYERWYRPERMIVVVVGDIAPDAIETRIRETFSTMTARGRAPREPALAPPQNPGRMLVNPSEAEPALHFSLGVAHAREAHDDTASRRRTLTRRLALDMLEHRLERLAEKPDAPFYSAEAFSSHYAPARELVLLRGSTRPSDWQKAILAFDLEVRRVNELGFHANELAHAVRRESARAGTIARQAVHRSSAELASTLAHATARGVVFTSESDDRELVTAQLAAIDLEQCHAAFRDMLYSGEWSLALVGPWSDKQAVALSFKESRSGELAPFEPPAPPRPFPLTDFGPAGNVVKRVRSDALDAELVQFANGVRLTVKGTSFEPGNVRVELRIGGGRLACPPDKPGLDWHSIAWLYGGIEGLSFEEQANAMIEIPYFTYSVTESASTFTTETDPANFLLLCQSGAALFKYPAFRPEGAVRALEFTRQATAPHRRTAAGVANVQLLHHLSGGHPAFHIPSSEESDQRTLDELKTWLVPHLASAPLDITVVGDVDPAAVIDACARTFGALPPRPPEDPFTVQRSLTPPSQPFSETVSFSGNEALAVVALAWRVPAPSSGRARAHAAILAEILQNRVYRKLRLELGETYSPSTSFYCDESFTPAIAFLASSIEADPARVNQVAAAARDVAGRLAREGATAEELERARQPLLRSAEAALRDNTWWVDTLETAQTRPASSAARLQAASEYASATLENINALARELLAADRANQLIATPR